MNLGSEELGFDAISRVYRNIEGISDEKKKPFLSFLGKKIGEDSDKQQKFMAFIKGCLDSFNQDPIQPSSFVRMEHQLRATVSQITGEFVAAEMRLAILDLLFRGLILADRLDQIRSTVKSNFHLLSSNQKLMEMINLLGILFDNQDEAHGIANCTFNEVSTIAGIDILTSADPQDLLEAFYRHIDTLAEGKQDNYADQLKGSLDEAKKQIVELYKKEYGQDEVFWQVLYRMNQSHGNDDPLLDLRAQEAYNQLLVKLSHSQGFLDQLGDSRVQILDGQIQSGTEEFSYVFTLLRRLLEQNYPLKARQALFEKMILSILSDSSDEDLSAFVEEFYNKAADYLDHGKYFDADIDTANNFGKAMKKLPAPIQEIYKKYVGVQGNDSSSLDSKKKALQICMHFQKRFSREGEYYFTQNDDFVEELFKLMIELKIKPKLATLEQRLSERRWNLQGREKVILDYLPQIEQMVFVQRMLSLNSQDSEEMLPLTSSLEMLSDIAATEDVNELEEKFDELYEHTITMVSHVSGNQAVKACADFNRVIEVNLAKLPDIYGLLYRNAQEIDTLNFVKSMPVVGLHAGEFFKVRLAELLRGELRIDRDLMEKLNGAVNDLFANAGLITATNDETLNDEMINRGGESKWNDFKDARVELREIFRQANIPEALFAKEISENEVALFKGVRIGVTSHVREVASKKAGIREASAYVGEQSYRGNIASLLLQYKQGDLTALSLYHQGRDLVKNLKKKCRPYHLLKRYRIWRFNRFLKKELPKLVEFNVDKQEDVCQSLFNQSKAFADKYKGDFDATGKKFKKLNDYIGSHKNDKFGRKSKAQTCFFKAYHYEQRGIDAGEIKSDQADQQQGEGRSPL